MKDYSKPLKPGKAIRYRKNSRFLTYMFGRIPLVRRDLRQDPNARVDIPDTRIFTIKVMRATFRNRFGDEQYRAYLAKDPKEEYVPPVPIKSRKGKESQSKEDSEKDDEETGDEEDVSETTVKAAGKAKVTARTTSKSKPSTGIKFKEPLVNLPPTTTSKTTTSSKAPKKPVRSSPIKTAKPSKSLPTTSQGEKSKKRDHSLSPPHITKKSRTTSSPSKPSSPLIITPTFTPTGSPHVSDREEDIPISKPIPKSSKKSFNLVDEATDEENEKEETEVTTKVVEVCVATPTFSEDEIEIVGEKTDEQVNADLVSEKDDLVIDDREGHGLVGDDRVPSDRVAVNVDDVIPPSVSEIPPSADGTSNLLNTVLTALNNLSNVQLEVQTTISKVLDNQVRMQDEIVALKNANASLQTQVSTLNSSLVETIKGESASITRAMSTVNAATVTPTTPTVNTDPTTSTSATSSELNLVALKEELKEQTNSINKLVLSNVNEAGKDLARSIYNDREVLLTKLSKIKTSLKTEMTANVTQSLLAVANSFGPKIEAVNTSLTQTARTHVVALEDHSGKIDRVYNIANSSLQEISTKLTTLQASVDELSGPAPNQSGGHGNRFAGQDEDEEGDESFMFPAIDSLELYDIKRRNNGFIIPGVGFSSNM